MGAVCFGWWWARRPLIVDSGVGLDICWLGRWAGIWPRGRVSGMWHTFCGCPVYSSSV